MTVSSSASEFTGVGNGVTTLFPMTDCIVFEKSHVTVEVDGVLQTLTTDYDVTNLNDDGGANVVFTVAPAVDAEITYARIVPIEQETDYENFDGQPADVTERQTDLIVMMISQIDAATTRSLRFPIGENFDTTIPPLSESGGKYLFRNVDGTVGVADGTTDTPISTALTPFVSSATIADARTELGLGTMALETAGDYLTVATAASTYAPLASPALTGTPTAPTPPVSTDTTQIATTAFVNDALGVADAWVNFSDGASPITPNKSYNVTSVTTSATGVFVVNITNAVADFNSAVMAKRILGNPSGFANEFDVEVGLMGSTTSFTLYTRTNNGTLADPTSPVCAVLWN